MTPFSIEPFDDLRHLNAPFEWLLNATLLVSHPTPKGGGFSVS